MQIAVTLEPKDMELVKDILLSLPENSTSSLSCIDYDYKTHTYQFVEDTEEIGENGEGKMKEHILTLEKAAKGFRMFLEAKAAGKLPGIHLGEDLGDAGSYDMWATDAIVQFALLGEVVYG